MLFFAVTIIATLYDDNIDNENINHNVYTYSGKMAEGETRSAH